MAVVWNLLVFYWPTLYMYGDICKVIENKCFSDYFELCQKIQLCFRRTARVRIFFSDDPAAKIDLFSVRFLFFKGKFHDDRRFFRHFRIFGISRENSKTGMILKMEQRTEMVSHPEKPLLRFLGFFSQWRHSRFHDMTWIFPLKTVTNQNNDIDWY